MNLSVSSSSWCLGKAAVCDCSTPWNFLLPPFFTLRGDLFYVLPCVILFLCFSVLLALRLPRLGKRDLILVHFRTFVRFVLVWICRFPLPLGVWEGLQFVIVALPGLFSYHLFFYSTRRFILCLTLCYFVLVFFNPFSIALTSLAEERANLSAFRAFVQILRLVTHCSLKTPKRVTGKQCIPRSDPQNAASYQGPHRLH